MQNVEIAEHERTKKNVELKTKRRDYTGYDDEEFAPGQQGMQRSVLAKYDEDIHGSQETVRNMTWATSLVMIHPLVSGISTGQLRDIFSS